MKKFVIVVLIIFAAFIFIGVGYMASQRGSDFFLTRFYDSILNKFDKSEPKIIKKEDAKNEVTEDEKTKIYDFLNDRLVIGFLGANYLNIDLNRVEGSVALSILNNSYVVEDGIVSYIDPTTNELFNKFSHKSIASTKGLSECFKTSEINQYLKSITNSSLNEENEDICMYMDDNQYVAFGSITLNDVSINNGAYIVTYVASDATDLIHIRETGTTADNKKEAKKYEGTVRIKSIDGKFILSSNSVQNGTDLYTNKK